ncbi:MAG: transporter substrate-binding domain-containing protein [Firmicutes bacterium]|nr:transporter substrate-binding domain-containing protein [Bacillota bacterium]
MARKFLRAAAAVFSALLMISTCISCSSNPISRVKQSGRLRVGYVSDNVSMDAPFVMNQSGITAEPAEKCARSLGVNAEFMRLGSDEAYQKLLDGTVDCLWNAPQPSKEYSPSVVTIDTDIYYRQVIMVKSDSKINRLADISGKAVAVVSGSDAQAALDEAPVMKSSVSQIKILNSMDEVLECLSSGAADCAAVDEPQALYSALNCEDKFRYIDTPISESKLVIAFRSEDNELCGKISEKYVSMVQNSEIEELCRKYTGLRRLNSSTQSVSSQI